MIIVNATLDGENIYDITVGESAIYRVSAFDLNGAIDQMADYLEAHNSKSLYVEADTLAIMAKCSSYRDTEAFAKAHNLTRCGTNGIYLEITNVKGCPNG
jgi:hypothetical protein